MKRKILNVLILFVMVIGLTACGNNESGSNSILGKGLKTKDLSIDDFAWETKETHIDGKKTYAMTLTNNSEYDILGVEIDYEVKSSATQEELKVFDKFMSDHADWIDEDETAEDITLIGKRQKLVKNGESVSQIILYIGMGTSYWHDRPDETQFDLMEPETLQMLIVGKDNKVYVAYYEFDDKEWDLDEETRELNKWPNNELSKKVTKPQSEYLLVTSDEEDDDVDFTMYGCTKDYFKEYVETIKSAGFNVDVPEDYSTYFSAEDSDGNSISVTYDKDNDIMKVSTYAG